MYCPKCGDIIETNERYCNKCGIFLGDAKVAKKEFKTIIFAITGLVILLIALTIITGKDDYYFSDQTYEEEIKVAPKSAAKGKYKTVTITDNVYTGIEINSKTDAYNLISTDSTKQKDTCPQNIIDLENKIIKNFNITAINMCELDYEFAKEISNVFEVVYKEYPSIRGYLTNMSLINAKMSEGYVAAFMPIFIFGESKKADTYPWIIKTQIFLNTAYFLNIPKLESSIKHSSISGHFPKNATKTSPVAHELAHYMSFIALMKNKGLSEVILVDNSNIEKLSNASQDFAAGEYSLTMIKEAYEKYKKEKGTSLSLDQWRSTISGYAVAKNNSGSYIYDETIAEAFHDVYLNKDNAADASKYVVAILKSKLEDAR